MTLSDEESRDVQSCDYNRGNRAYRSALLRCLKDQLATGHYHPAPELLADRMISRAFFDLLDRYPEYGEPTTEP